MSVRTCVCVLECIDVWGSCFHVCGRRRECRREVGGRVHMSVFVCGRACLRACVRVFMYT